jgi:hypothetical protein
VRDSDTACTKPALPMYKTGISENA